ncbi:MAG: VWA domain-containing protein [Planctomycetales bacterium]|nr:VWA domain-containing protein [Planctomycetales bacterium]
MADWRQDDSGKRKPKPKPLPKDVVPKTEPATVGGWRGKHKPSGAATSGSVAQASERSWTGAGAIDSEAVSGSVLRKWLFVSVLFGLFLVLLAGLLYFAFSRPRPLPLFIFSVGTYASPELMENPFGDAQRDRLFQVNDRNVAAHRKVLEGNDNALSELNSDTWLDRFEEISSTTIPPGGPGRRVVAFYISAMATFDIGGEIWIHSQQDSPYQAIEAQQTPGVSLVTALNNLGDTVRPGSVAWIILDLQLPSVVVNLGDLDRPWKTAVEAALAKVDESLRDRLLITLPCDDGQQNWLAPEYSSSFFGYYLEQMLSGTGTGKAGRIDPQITVGEFADLLGEKTAGAVANRRFAKQTPVWLPKGTFEQMQGARLLTIVDDEPKLPTATLPLPDQLNSIGNLWDRLTNKKYYRAYRWDPLGYAKVESQLLGLEEAALYRPNAFSSAKQRVESALAELPRPQVRFGVSLIEDRLRDEYFHGANTDVETYATIDQLTTRLASQLSEATPKLPSFWKKSDDAPVAPQSAEGQETAPAGAAEPNVPPESTLAASDRGRLVWQLYAQCAQGDYRLWEQAFRPERIRSALDYASASEFSLELYILDRLASDIDWAVFDVVGDATASGSNSSQDYAPSCAKAIDLFRRIQQVASIPEPEVCWWQLQSLPTIEARYLRALDLLLASQFSEAFEEFVAVDASLQSVEQDLSDLAMVVDATQRALHHIPHLLAWMMREYQLTDVQNERPWLERQLAELATIADLTNEIHQQLSQNATPTPDRQLLASGKDLQQRLESLEGEFTGYVGRLTGTNEGKVAGNSPLTFRRERIALMSPLLALDLRGALQTRSSEYLGMALDDSSNQPGATLPEQPRASNAADRFLASLRGDKKYWESILKSDARIGLVGQFQYYKEPNLDVTESLRTELLTTEYWLRGFAGVYGGSGTLHDQLSALDSYRNGWPWTCAWQRWMLSSANYRVMQVQRLAQASWGKATVTDATVGDQFLFYGLAERYTESPDFAKFVPINRLASHFLQRRRQLLEESVSRLKSIKTKFGEVATIDVGKPKQMAPVMVNSAPWNAVANVYLQVEKRRQPWTSSNAEDRAWPVELNAGGQQSTTKFFDSSYWQGGYRVPQGNLLIRGNLFSQAIDWKPVESRIETYVLRMQKERPNGATIKVLPPEEPPAISVFLLVDCSQSMSTQVPLISEDGQVSGDKVPLFNNVKANTKRVLERLAEIHGSEAVVDVALIPFGLKKQDAESSLRLKEFLDLRRSDLDVFRSKRMSPLDPDWLVELNSVIDLLKPSGDTPLYDAMAEACELSKSAKGEKCFIYVFTDGVNHINVNADNNPQNDVRVTDSETIRSIVEGNSRIRLSVFYYNYFEEWIKHQQQQAEWRKVFNSGLEELNSLKSSLGEERFGFYNRHEANQLLNDSLARIPTSSVSVLPAGKSNAKPLQSPLGQAIRIPQDELPAHYEVVVAGDIGSAGGTVEARGGEAIVLQFKSGQRELEFLRTARRGERPQRSGDKLASEVSLQPRFERLDSHQELGIALSFWKQNIREFTFRPLFIVAEVTPSADRDADSILLADHWFTSEIPYPEAQLGFFPWPLRKSASVRVWASDSIPSLVEQRVFSAGDVQENVRFENATSLNSVQIDVQHKGDQVAVTVRYPEKPSRQQRVVVVCPEYAKSHRQFQINGLQETHTFLLPDVLANQPAQLQFTTVADLEASVSAQDATELIFAPLTTN